MPLQQHTLSKTFSALNKKDFSQQGKTICSPLQHIPRLPAWKEAAFGLVSKHMLSLNSSLEKNANLSGIS